MPDKTFSRAESAFRTVAVLLASAAAPLAAQAPAARLTIDPAHIVSPVSPTLYGLMTEEINHSYDGGLHAELISNNTFRKSWDGVAGWTVLQRGDARMTSSVDTETGPSKALPRSLSLSVDAASPRNEAGVSNAGYWGIAVRPHTTYRGSFYGKAGEMSPGTLTAKLVSDDSGATLAEAVVTLKSGPWSRYEFALNTGAVTTTSRNHLELTMTHPGKLWLQLVSLMPPTYNNRPNGNRPDLMERMAAMHPHFLRLPGGNYLEGDTLEDWYNWKQTIGPRVDRPGHQAPWTYWSTDSMGLLEFLEWCEDLHIEPVLAVYAGYALHGEHVTGDELKPYVQSALDEVEYVTGDVSTKWGARRAQDGHPAPFPLHYIEIGNEDWFDKAHTYDSRWTQFANALRKAYPQYKLIATTPVKGAVPDLIDDHYYKSPTEMFEMVHHYDDAPRNGPQVFVGEWATRSGTPTPNFGDALGDAAFMTSMERNSDLIKIASYAPLLVNVSPGAMQWATDLIGFDALTTYASPSYYAQCLFAAHIGDGTAQSKLTDAHDRFFYSATVSTDTHVLHLKLVNASTEDQPLTLDLHGVARAKPVEVSSLHAATFQATNSITRPDVIHPTTSTAHLHTGEQSYTVPALTIQVLDIPLDQVR